ncbi:MAG TPA: glycosyl transferase [Rhodospirillaceae bacterium]|nr:glycosyl transferase [Candidatus Neomarinimicrobiota bacterium]HCX15099.1 glycosyl transferase [Rhodospirillaceae bacterium]|tara:strand:+ start:403 stop:993 length:591 start_codon:yes stop_codon:yes gene_type:complete
MKTLAILTVACWSGFMVMGLEILSGRILAPTFGNSIYVWGAVITVFMLALSVGYLVGGRMSLAQPKIRTLCIMHFLSGVSLLPIIAFANPVLDMVFAFTQDPRTGSLISCVILFFAPAVLCGAISPYAVRLLVSEANAAGFYAGLLFFFSTAFSAAGTLLTSFYFVLIFEVNQIVILLMSTAMLMAIGAFALSRKE